MTGAQSFSFARSFDSAPETVWSAWSKSPALAAWLAPQGCAMDVVTFDFTEGGMFHYGLRLPTGAVMWGRWDFIEIEPQKRLVYLSAFSAEEAAQTTRNPVAPTWPLSVHTTIEFREKDGGTELVFTWAPHDAAMMEVMTFNASHDAIRMVWDATFQQLDAYLAAV